MSQQMIVIDENRLSILEQAFDRFANFLYERKVEDVYNEIFDPKDAAKYLKISTRYLQDLKAKGEIKFSQYEKIVRYRKQDLDEWLTRHRVARG